MTIKRRNRGFAHVFSVFLFIILAFLPGCQDNSNSDQNGGNSQTVSASGKITLGTAGLSGVAVTISGTDISARTTSTLTSGCYSFDSLSAGTCRITPAKDNYTFTPAYIDITLSRGNSANNDFTASATSGADDPSGSEKVKLVFVGDINLGTKVGESVAANGNGDYNFPFIHVSSYLGAFDLAFGNLESIISDKGETTKPVTGVDLRANPDAVSGLLGAGFDVVSVANNHAGDFGEEGMTDSFARVKAAGIDIAGGGGNRTEARTAIIREVKGVRIACLSYTNVPMYMDSYGFGQTPVARWIATDKRPGIAWAHDSRFESFGTIDDMCDDIASAAAKADIIVVMVHFGWEYKYEPDDAQIQFAHAAIDAGADFVMGHHPHVTQETEEYNGGFIAYSLGNFVFDISEEMATGTTRGMIIEATIQNGTVNDVKTRYSNINSLYQVTLEE